MFFSAYNKRRKENYSSFAIKLGAHISHIVTHIVRKISGGISKGVKSFGKIVSAKADGVRASVDGRKVNKLSKTKLNSSFKY